MLINDMIHGFQLKLHMNYEMNNGKQIYVINRHLKWKQLLKITDIEDTILIIMLRIGH